MISTEVVLLILGAIFTTSTQQPFILRSNYKGLRGIVPSAKIFSTGLIRAVYYHDQTVAVVDIDQTHEINDCNIVEGYEPQEIDEILSNLSKTVRPSEVSFSQMTELMYRCQQFDKMRSDVKGRNDTAKDTYERAIEMKGYALNIFSGILPGTKWCGTGDVAKDYHDLGSEADIDRCCRTHDLCPVKIRAQRTRYNLTNNALYSKSHCACDNALFHCLKDVASPAANLMGKLYFNVAEVECVDDVQRGNKKFGVSAKIFSSTELVF